MSGGADVDDVLDAAGQQGDEAAELGADQREALAALVSLAELIQAL